MNQKVIIGIDLGATNIRGGIVSGSTITAAQAKPVQRNGTADQVLRDVFDMGLTKKVGISKNEKYMARPGGLYIFKEHDNFKRIPAVGDSII